MNTQKTAPFASAVTAMREMLKARVVNFNHGNSLAFLCQRKLNGIDVTEAANAKAEELEKEAAELLSRAAGLKNLARAHRALAKIK